VLPRHLARARFTTSIRLRGPSVGLAERLKVVCRARRRTNPTSHELQHIQPIESTETSRANPTATTQNATHGHFILAVAAAVLKQRSGHYVFNPAFYLFIRRRRCVSQLRRRMFSSYKCVVSSGPDFPQGTWGTCPGPPQNGAPTVSHFISLQFAA
jgi:hypothetical protein